MQLTEVFCYALLTITISTVCAQAERHKGLGERKNENRLRRREATIIVEDFPTENTYEKPKVVFRRLSKHRYGPQKSKYDLTKPFYNYGKSTRRPGGKTFYKGKLNSKYGYAHFKQVTNNPKYRPSRKIKPHHGPPKKRNPYVSAYSHHENTGFGEPPNFVDDYKPIKTTAEFDDFHKSTDDPTSIQGYGEPPVDSYGAPIQLQLHDLISPTSHNIPNLAEINDKYNKNFALNLKTWRNYQQENDKRMAFSKKKPAFVELNPDANVYVTPLPKDEHAELHLNSYSDIYSYRHYKENNNKKYFRNNVKIMNRPWKGKLRNTFENEAIVGGQYAEPPARYVPTSPNAIASNVHYEVVAAENEDPDVVSSATNSPYVNYKHSNVAFSPQNLNDAFSIVD